MSALSLMCRTAIIVVALATLTLAGASGAQVSQAGKTHRRPAATAAHRVHRTAPAHGVHRVTATHTPSHTQANAARKRTPDEVGRMAGLAIRRQLARKQEARRAAAVRAERTRNARRPRLERAALRRAETRAARAYESREAAAAYQRPDLQQPETDETKSMESRRAGVAREAMPAEPRDREESADTETAPADGTEPAESATEKEDGLAGQDGDEAPANAASQPGEAADALRPASRTDESEEALLYVPRGGMPAPLRGSLASLERQNARLDAEGLERIEDEADLAARIANKLLVPLPASSALKVNADLPENHRYCRPWTARFLSDLARAHEAAFHRPLEVSSAVRTVEYQKRLMRTNGNAAPAEGDLVSPHETGATIDIAKSGLSRAEVAWMRTRLAALEATGKIDVEEEFQQACFHITVYKSYAPARKAGGASPTRPGTRPARPQTDEPAQEPAAQGT